MSATRREALLSGLFGAGWIGLRALGTGLPMTWLLSPRRALAASCEGADQARAQYLILSTSGAGDPLNANVPGTYEHPDIVHSPDPQMARAELRIGGRSHFAAKPWAGLPEAVLARTCFFHHTTLTNNHGNQPKVMRLMGAIKRQEMLVSLLAKELAPCLGTVQREPAVVGAAGPGEYLSFERRVLPNLTPTALRDVLISPQGPLTRLQQIRDRDIDRLNALFKERGTAPQRRFLDRLALSQREARALSDSLLESLASITSNDIDGQITAAIALIRMNVAPVVSLHIPFGGDNHTDVDLARETAQTVAGVAAIGQLQQQLQAQGLQDRVTFVAMNVFGRTLSVKRKGTNGRDHLANHHCTVMIGKGLRGGVVGGLEPRGDDFAAQAIDSRTGRGGAGGDVTFEDTLGAVGKTLGAAVGVSRAVLDEHIGAGKVVAAALA